MQTIQSEAVGGGGQEEAQTPTALMKPYCFGIGSFSPFTHQASNATFTIAGWEQNLPVIE